MVKGRKGNMVIIGLSDRNIELLTSDKPIKFNLQELGMGDIDVMIFHGKDEQTMYEMMKDATHPMKTIIKSDRAKDN